MAEKSSYRVRLRIALGITAALLVLLTGYLMTIQKSRPAPPPVAKETASPFRLTKRDTLPARLENKMSKRELWKRRIKMQRLKKMQQEKDSVQVEVQE